MIFFSDELLNQIKTYFNLSEAKIELRSEWGSASPNHREKIYQQLALPQQEILSHLNLSVSHTLDVGGYLRVKFMPHQKGVVGFDVEQISRIQPRIVQRMQFDEAEFSKAVSAAALWTAKEAVFKSFRGPKQPLLLSDIQISDWQQKSHFATFTGSSRNSEDKLKTKGLTFQQNQLQIALSVSETSAN